MDRVRVLVVDDHALLREALRLLLDAQPDLQVVAEAGTAAAGLKQALVCDARVILLDLVLPDKSGIAVLPELRQHCPSSRVVVLTMHDEPEYVRAALAAGAAGYVVKSSKSSVLVDAIRTVSRGDTFLDPAIKAYAAETVKPTHSSVEVPPIARLSDREKQVLYWLAQGLSYQAIADKIRISVKTVETYRSRLTAKLGFTNRADLMRFAIETELVDAQPPVGPE